MMNQGNNKRYRNPYNKFAKKIKKRRKAKYSSPNELNEKLSFDTSVIWKLENGDDVNLTEEDLYSLYNELYSQEYKELYPQEHLTYEKFKALFLEEYKLVTEDSNTRNLLRETGKIKFEFIVIGLDHFPFQSKAKDKDQMESDDQRDKPENKSNDEDDFKSNDLWNSYFPDKKDK